MSDAIVVIGSNCFTGSHIVESLLKNTTHPVHGISRSPEYKEFFLPYKADKARFTFYQMDLVREFSKLQSLLEKLQPQIVINVAALSEVALSNDKPVEYFAINTQFVSQLCDFLRKTTFCKKYVHISSAEIFGSCTEPADEKTPFYPSTPYAVSKAAADMFLYTLMKNYDFPALIIRSTNVFGKHQQLFKIIPRTAIYLKQGKTLELHGGGVAKKSFIHIEDVVNGLMLALEKDKTGTYHFSVPSTKSVAEVVKEVCDLMGYNFNQSVNKVGERLGQDAQYILDCSKAENELGWSPKKTFSSGVAETIDWVERYWNQIEREPLIYVHK